MFEDNDNNDKMKIPNNKLKIINLPRICLKMVSY